MIKFELRGRLGKGKFVIIDDEDFERVSKHNWHFDGKYPIHYWYVSEGSSIRLHRYIMNAQKGQEIDHIDRNPLNNQKSNLRFCTSRENKLNRTPRIINYKKYKILTKSVSGDINCKICKNNILKGQKYYDGQKNNRIHTDCYVT